MFDVGFIEKSLGIKKTLAGSPAIREWKGFSIDSRTVTPEQCFVAIPGENFDGHRFIGECYDKGVRAFIIEKSKRHWALKRIPEGYLFCVGDTVKALGQAALAYRSSIFASVLAITGSSGKTTTREMIVRILSKKYNIHTAKKNFNNEIGLPLTILEAPVESHIIVLELGMNHKGEIKRLAKIAEPLTGLITNVGYAHIGQLGSLDAIADAKAEIFQGINRHGFIFLNEDDDYFSYFSRMSPVEVIGFSHSDFQILEDRQLDGYRLSYQNQVFDYPLPGIHNLVNLAGAFKIGEFYQVDPLDMVDAVRSFTAVAGRSEVMRGSITLINDCYNANPSSMKAGLSVLASVPSRKVAVLSDMLELGSHSAELHMMIGEFISQNHSADTVFAYGEASHFLADAAVRGGTDMRWFAEKEEMISALVQEVRKGDTVLVKASRGMKLEDAVSALSQKFGLIK